MSWLSLRQEQEQKIRQEAMLGMMLELDLMLEGHFDFGNGWHGTSYLNAHPLLDDPYRIYQLTEELKGVIPIDIREKVQLVAGPITGGVLLAKDMAVALDRDRKREEKRVRLAPVYKADGQLALRTHYRKLIAGDFGDLKGMNVLVVDDVCNTGNTLRATAKLIEEAGGHVLGSAVLYDRLATTKDLENHFFLGQVDIDPELVKADKCLCNRIHLPITQF